MRDRKMSSSCEGPRESKINIFKDFIEASTLGTLHSVIKAEISIPLRIENFLRNYNFPKHIFCTHQNRAFR